MYYTLADGNQAAISELKRSDVFEFFTRLKVWASKTEERIEAYKAALSGL